MSETRVSEGVSMISLPIHPQRHGTHADRNFLVVSNRKSGSGLGAEFLSGEHHTLISTQLIHVIENIADLGLTEGVTNDNTKNRVDTNLESRSLSAVLEEENNTTPSNLPAGERRGPRRVLPRPREPLARAILARRLDAEEVRDAMLSVSGRLDPRSGGPAADGIDTPRRSLYVQTAQWDRSSFAMLFDAANPDASTEKRNPSTVAPPGAPVPESSLRPRAGPEPGRAGWCRGVR